MFMRFVGGGIGHKSSDHHDIQQSTMAPNWIEDDAHDHGAQDELEDTFLHKTQDQARADEDVNADGDPDEVDAEEEADYGYVDDSDSDIECASEGSEDSDDESENGDKDEYDVL
jgi:hypothetical protein